MARYKSYRQRSWKSGRYKQRRWSKKQSYANRITRLARDLGAIDRGRKNPESKVSAAYNAGNNGVKRTRKSLF